MSKALLTLFPGGPVGPVSPVGPGDPCYKQINGIIKAAIIIKHTYACSRHQRCKMFVLKAYSLADQTLHRHPYHLEHHPNPVGGRKSDVTSWKQPENVFVTTTFKH